jgi:hypothetical protein
MMTSELYKSIFLKTMILAIQSVKLADVKKSAGVVRQFPNEMQQSDPPVRYG